MGILWLVTLVLVHTPNVHQSFFHDDKRIGTVLPPGHTNGNPGTSRIELWTFSIMVINLSYLPGSELPRN